MGSRVTKRQSMGGSGDNIVVLVRLSNWPKRNVPVSQKMRSMTRRKYLSSLDPYFRMRDKPIKT